MPGSGKIIALGGGSGTVTTSSNGTNNTIAKFTGTTAIANSSITDNGTTITLGEAAQFGTGLGAITQLTGPSDQSFTVASGSGGDMIFNSSSGHDVIFQAGGVECLRAAHTQVITMNKPLTNCNGTAAVGNYGFPLVVAIIDLTAQSAAIAATNIIASAPRSTVYHIAWVASVTTASDQTSTLGGANGLQVNYTDQNDSVVKTTAASQTSSANTTATCIQGVIAINAKAATAIQYQIGYTDTHTTTAMQYNLHLRLVAY